MKFKEMLFVSNLLASGVKHGRFYRIIKMSAVIGVALGTMALLISTAILQGFEDEMRESAVKFTSHIKVEAYKVNRIDDYPIICDIIKEKYPAVKKIAPYVQKEVLISSKHDVDGILMKCISANQEITGIKDKIIAGGMPNSNTNQIIIGERLAKKLDIKIGKSVNVFMANDPEQDFPDIEKFQVSGIYRTGMAKYDDIYVYGDLSFIQNIMNYSATQCTGLDIMLDSVSKIAETSGSLEKFLDFPYMCSSVFELHAAMFAWIDMQKEPIPLVLTLITIVASMNIITILLILIVEKIHSIGVLRSIGMKNRDILLIMVSRGLSIGLAGTLCGTLISFIFCYLQKNYEIITLNGDIYFLDALPISFVPDNFVLVPLFSMTIAFMASLIPAVIATRISPIKALNFK